MLHARDTGVATTTHVAHGVRVGLTLEQQLHRSSMPLESGAVDGSVAEAVCNVDGGDTTRL